MQVGARRIDFVNEGIDSIEVKMPPPRRMREAAMSVCALSLNLFTLSWILLHSVLALYQVSKSCATL